MGKSCLSRATPDYLLAFAIAKMTGKNEAAVFLHRQMMRVTLEVNNA